MTYLDVMFNARRSLTANILLVRRSWHDGNGGWFITLNVHCRITVLNMYAACLRSVLADNRHRPRIFKVNFHHPPDIDDMLRAQPKHNPLDSHPPTTHNSRWRHAGKSSRLASPTLVSCSSCRLRG